MVAPLVLELPVEYRHAANTHKLFTTTKKLDRNPEDYPTTEAFQWALTQMMTDAYRHSFIHKTHWILITAFDGQFLISVPGFQKL